MPETTSAKPERNTFTDDKEVYLLNGKLRRYFEISVEGCSSTDEQEDQLSRRLFWEEIYRPRELERAKFEELLNDTGTRLILITGQVGCGKSTFILDKIESRSVSNSTPLCGGLRIDLEKHQSELRVAERSARHLVPATHQGENPGNYVAVILNQYAAAAIDQLIATKVRDRFIGHFKILLESRDKPVEDILDPSIVRQLLGRRELPQNPTVWQLFQQYDVANRPFLQLPWPKAARDNLLAAEAEAAAAAALVLSGQLESHRRLQDEVIRDSGLDTLESQFEALFARLSGQPERVAQLLSLDPLNSAPSSIDKTTGNNQAQVWLRAYAAFFRHEKAVLAIDNGDCLAHADMHRVLYDYADELSKAIGIAESDLLRPVKIILSMREQNLDPAKRHAEGTRSPSAIVLGTKPFGLHPEHSEFLGLTQNCMREILEKRISLCQRMLHADAPEASSKVFEQFANTVRSIWIPLFEGSPLLHKHQLKPTLLDLSNESIRIGIAMVRHSSIALVYGARQNANNSWTNYGSEQFKVTSSIIGWLFQGDQGGTALQDFIRKERKLIREGDSFCCSHRMTLTYLYNRMEEYQSKKIPDSRVTAHQLFERLERGIGIQATQTREALWFLYKPGLYHREYVTIEQSRPLLDASSIDLNAGVYINRRGRVLIRVVIQTLDYWARLAHKQPIDLDALCDRDPAATVDFIKPILETVEDTANAHEKNWRELACSEERFGSAKDNYPFRDFRKEFAVGHDFFLERVAKSHISALTGYVQCLLRNLVDQRAITLDEYQKIERLHSQRKREAIKDFYMNHPKAPWHTELGQLLSFLDDYQNVVLRFASLKKKTFAMLASNHTETV